MERQSSEDERDENDEDDEVEVCITICIYELTIRPISNWLTGFHINKVQIFLL